MKFNEFYNLIDDYAPFIYSDELCKATGMYDNSGAILETTEDIASVVFTLDLTNDAVEFAIQKSAKLIVTHHPAIYTPLKKLEGALKTCAKHDIGVISAHLNMDTAKKGIDYFQAKGIGAKCENLFCKLPSGGGYGRIFEINKKLSEIFEAVKKEFNADKARLYGNNNRIIKTVASFCGAGLDLDQTNANADLFISADIRHHVIKDLLERDKCVIELTHYASENYGFKCAFNELSERAELKNIKKYYFDDERFV